MFSGIVQEKDQSPADAPGHARGSGSLESRGITGVLRGTLITSAHALCGRLSSPGHFVLTCIMSGIGTGQCASRSVNRSRPCVCRRIWFKFPILDHVRQESGGGGRWLRDRNPRKIRQLVFSFRKNGGKIIIILYTEAAYDVLRTQEESRARESGRFRQVFYNTLLLLLLFIFLPYILYNHNNTFAGIIIVRIALAMLRGVFDPIHCLQVYE